MTGLKLCRRDFTFVCPTEILAYNDALPQFEALNTVVLGWFCDCYLSLNLLMHRLQVYRQTQSTLTLRGPCSLVSRADLGQS